jgi:hypothetical protein
MKHLRTSRGPFAERPYYTDKEIETICTDELLTVKLLPDRPEAIRIERFIEKRFGVTPEYANLPEGILGMTQFSARGVKKVIVARALEDEGSETAQRRVRSTFAHEGGHGLLHSHLFALGVDAAPLFADTTDPEKPKVLCRGEGGAHSSYSGEWWEFQANRAMGALLMPQALVDMAVEPFLVPTGSFALPALDRSRFEEAVRFLANIFEVNPAVARIRLNTLYPESDTMQLKL